MWAAKCESLRVETNEITRIIVDTAYKIEREVGPGLYESVYEVLLADALIVAGFCVERQHPVPIRIGDKFFEEGFRADLVVEGRVIVEVKSVDELAPIHKKQLMTYLRLSGIPVGLLINFGGNRMKGNIERLVVGNAPDIKQPRPDQPNP
jgi:iron complex transport system substrate-binding protein